MAMLGFSIFRRELNKLLFLSTLEIDTTLYITLPQLILPYQARQDFSNVILSVISKESIYILFILCFKIWDVHIKQNEVE